MTTLDHIGIAVRSIDWEFVGADGQPVARDAVGHLGERPRAERLDGLPVVLGFWPEESVVMLTFGAPRPFHARVDLPPLAFQTPESLDQLAETLVEPAHRHGSRAIVLLYLTADPAAASVVHRALRRAANQARIQVVTAVSADGSHYRELTGPFASSTAPATPYDVSAHPFVVQALVSGRLEHPTRKDMVAGLATDEPALADLVAMGTGMCGWDARISHEGFDAVQQARDFAPDVLVLDRMLPGLDGLEVLARIRQSYPEVPVLFLTAKDTVQDRIEGLASGGDDYVTKPFSIEEVLIRLHRLVQRSGVAAQDSATLVVGTISVLVFVIGSRAGQITTRPLDARAKAVGHLRDARSDRTLRRRERAGRGDPRLILGLVHQTIAGGRDGAGQAGAGD